MLGGFMLLPEPWLMPLSKDNRKRHVMLMHSNLSNHGVTVTRM